MERKLSKKQLCVSMTSLFEVYEHIDCSKCLTTCRNDTFNRTLNTLAMDVTHSEFL